MEVRFLPPIIGLTGKAGSGKDTLAAYTVREFGYVRYSLADPIKMLLNERFGWKPEWWEDREWKERAAVIHGARQLECNCGMEKFSPRSWAQWLGTEVGRYLAGEDVWVDALLALSAGNGHAKRTVIPDVRFNNEAKKIQDMGGIIIHVARDTQPVEGHVSERGVDDLYIDYYVENNRTVQEAEEDLWDILLSWEKDFGISRA